MRGQNFDWFAMEPNLHATAHYPVSARSVLVIDGAMVGEPLAVDLVPNQIRAFVEISRDLLFLID